MASRFLRRLNTLAGTINEALWDKPRKGDWIAAVSGPNGKMVFDPIPKGTRKTDYMRQNPEVKLIAILQVIES